MEERERSFWQKHVGFIGWVIVIVGVVISLAWDAHLSKEAELINELRVHQLCENQNDTRRVLREVIEIFVEVRNEERPERAEKRAELLDRVYSIISEENCPPLPEYFQDRELP